MKSILIASTIFLLSAIPAFAQETTINLKSPIRQNELGLFGQTDLSDNGGTTNFILAGVQYKRWVTPNVSYRVLAAYGQYSYNSGENRIALNKDTILTRQKQVNIDMPVVGVGMDVQRHFYKRVYLFAGLEVKGGYGRGNADTLSRLIYGPQQNNNDETNISRSGSQHVSMLRLNLAASIGAKLQYNRLSVGLELFPIQAGYEHTKDNTGSNSLTDLNTTFSQRIFFHYRF